MARGLRRVTWNRHMTRAGPARSCMPRKWRVALWGDRDRWPTPPDRNDPMWQEWQTTYGAFYEANQRQGVGQRVNDAGYRVMSRVDLDERVVLEIGPGDIRHSRHWTGRPAHVHLVDVDEKMMNRGAVVLSGLGVPFSLHLLEGEDRLPFPEGSVDVVVSFYSLEHLWMLPTAISEIKRVMAPTGVLVGAIPAEGGLAWGIGRLLTSRRWLLKHTSIDPGRLICWEHPNFADDIVDQLDAVFERRSVRFWPLPWVRSIDPNLVVTFVYEQPRR